MSIGMTPTHQAGAMATESQQQNAESKDKNQIRSADLRTSISNKHSAIQMMYTMQTRQYYGDYFGMITGYSQTTCQVSMACDK